MDNLMKSLYFAVVLTLLSCTPGLSAADKGKVSFPGSSWTWLKTEYSGGNVLQPKKAGVFAIQFEESKLSVDSDCNALGGKYEVKGERIQLGPIAGTRRYCVGSVELPFVRDLQAVTEYEQKGDRELTLSGKGFVMHFAKRSYE